MEWFLVDEKDKEKKLSLTFTANEWQMIRAAMQDYSHVIDWIDFPKEAQLKITNALKSNFSVED